MKDAKNVDTGHPDATLEVVARDEYDHLRAAHAALEADAYAFKELSRAQAQALVHMHDAARDLGDWCADTVLGESGVQAVDRIREAAHEMPLWHITELQARAADAKAEGRKARRSSIFRRLKDRADAAEAAHAAAVEALEAWASWWNGLPLDEQVRNHGEALAAMTATRAALVGKAVNP